jgi:hypothetical protein
MDRSTRCRVTNGHRAAVCGLVIAGVVSLTDACLMAGVPYKALRDVLPPGWHTKKMPCVRWKGDLLLEVKEAWCDRAQKVTTIAERYDVSPRTIGWLAKREGWPKRKRGPARNPFSQRSGMTRRQYDIARMVRRNTPQPAERA